MKKEMVNKITAAKVIVEAYIISSDSLMLPEFYVNMLRMEEEDGGLLEEQVIFH